MRFVFFPVNCRPFHGNSLDERPLGGTETSVIRLAEALNILGHEVFVITPFKEAPATPVKYLTPAKASRIGPTDVLIVVRGLTGLFLPFEAKKTLYWVGDAWDNNHTFGLGDQRYVRKIDAFLAVSNWHAQTLCYSSGFPLEKTYVLRNGVYLDYFKGTESKNKKRLIYSSTPYRGLTYLPEIYRELKYLHPELELSVFSSMAVYQEYWTGVSTKDEHFEPLYEELRNLPGCTVHGSILQRDLAREYMKAGIWVYPTDFSETSCITAMEAQAGGCATVATGLAALPETVGEAGILIDEMPGTPNYRKRFVESVDRLLKDDTMYHHYQKKALERAVTFDWKKRAEGLLVYLSEKWGLH